MKFFKLIIKVLLVIVFILSVSLNVLLFSSSYGSLVLKYDEQKFIAMNDNSFNDIYSFLLSPEKNSGLQIEAENIFGYEKVVGNYHYDDKYKFTFSVTLTTKEYTEHIYYKEDTIYADNINNSGTKMKAKMDASSAGYYQSFFYTVFETFHLQADLIKDQETKTKLAFSFSPFYFIGLKYEYENSTEDTYRYDYDFNGHLRKISVKTKDTESTIKINYKNKDVSLPNLEEFN